MGIKELRKAWREQVRQAAETMDLPQSTLTGMARLVLDGGEVEIQGHLGILEYGEEQITVSVKDGCIRVTGSGMHLTAMSEGALRFSGLIAGIELLN